MTVGIVAALPEEARCLGAVKTHADGSCTIDDNVLLRIAGMGTNNADAAARELVNNGASALVAWGFAGALDSSLQPGAIVLPRTVIDVQRTTHVVDREWQEQLHRALTAEAVLAINTGMLVTCAATIATAAEKSRLHQALDAVAVDMESAAVAAVAHDAGMPFLAIRCITDDAGMRLPSVALSFIDIQGHSHPLRGLRQWARHPQQTSDLLRLARGTQHAQRGLRSVVAMVGPQLLAPSVFAADD